MPILLFPPPSSGSPPIDGIDLEVELGEPIASSSSIPGQYPNPADAPGYTLRAVTMFGEVLGELPVAKAETITRTLNGEREATISSPKAHPSTALLSPFVEVQIHRNGALRFWGPLVGDSSSSDQGATGFPARGPWWYFRRRRFGTANRTNILRNAGFEQDFAAWRAVGTTPEIRTADELEVADPPAAPLTGSKVAAGLVGDGESAYLIQRRSYRTEWPAGQLLTLAAWVYLYAYTGPAAGGYGLYLSRVVAGEVIRTAIAEIDDDTPRGQWTRLETSLVVPPFEDGVLEARLYFPGGASFWDHAVLVLMESTSSAFDGDDQTELARKVIRYAQHGRGKSDLNIGTATAPTGVVVRRAWQHERHEVISDAVSELAAGPTGFDFSIDLTETTRTFRTHYPRKGTDRRGELTLELGVNVARYSRLRDGTTAASSVVVKAPGDGPDREEGGSIDTSNLGGLILEDVIDAPESLPISELDDFAEEEREARDDVIPVLELVTYQGAGDLLELLETGDVVDVVIDDGSVQVNAAYRIVRIVERCRDETLVVTGNIFEEAGS